MKIITILLKLIKKVKISDKPRADLYLPDWLLIMGIILIGSGVGMFGYSLFNFEFMIILTGIAAILLGIIACMCWKNQTIRIISTTQFEYTTFLGNKRTYFFNQIQGVKKNSDSITLFVNNEKVHIESCAIMSDELAIRLDKELDRLNMI